MRCHSVAYQICDQETCLYIAPKTGRIKNMDMPLWWQM